MSNRPLKWTIGSEFMIDMQGIEVTGHRRELSHVRLGNGSRRRGPRVTGL